jgi:hypothetical protein
MFEKLRIVLGKDASWFERNTGMPARMLESNLALSVTDLFQVFCVSIAEYNRIEVYLDDAENNEQLSDRVYEVFSPHLMERWENERSAEFKEKTTTEVVADHLQLLKYELCDVFGVDDLEIFDFQLKYKFLTDKIMRQSIS